MSDIITNMKVRFGADTRQLKKGSDEGAAAVKHFTGEASNNLSSFAGVFGVNIGAVTGHINTFKAGTTAMSGGLKGATRSSGVFSGALKFLKVALLGTGVGALVVALGVLVTYFTSTQRGANKLSKIMAAIGAVVDVVTDRASALGEKVFWAFNHPKEAILGLWETLKKNVLNRVTGIMDVFSGLGKMISSAFDLDFDGVKKHLGEVKSSLVQATTGIDTEQQKKIIDGVKGLVHEIKEEASAAAILNVAQNKLEAQQVALIESYAKRRAEVERLRLASKDETKSAEDRANSLQKAADIEKTILDDQLRMQKEKVRILFEQQALGENMLDDDREYAEEKAKLWQLEASYLQRVKKLKTMQNTLDKQISKEDADRIKKKYNGEVEAHEIALIGIHAKRQKAIEKLNIVASDNTKTEEERSEALQKIAHIEEDIISDNIKLQKEKIKAIEALKAAGHEEDNGKLLATEKAKLDSLESSYAKTMHNIAAMSKEVGNGLKDVFIDFGTVMNQSMEGFAVGFGENIGQLLAGVDGVQSFSSLVAGTLADMAIKVGKIAVGTGVAMIGIKKALLSMNPVAAIAGGVALIALGTWAKSSLASAAEGGSSGFSANANALSGNVDRTSKSNSNVERQSQQVYVHVGGEFKMKGNTLVAAVENENRRKGIVT